MNRQPKHSEIDSELLTLPPGLFWNAVILATILIFVVVWALLFAAMSAGWLGWVFWPYVTVPLIIWVALFALQLLGRARTIALGHMDAQIETIEAWTARAGYSIDLNGDGYIGRHIITVDQPEVVRPLIVSAAPQGLRLLASDAATPFDPPGIDPAPVTTAATTPPPARPRVWTMVDGTEIPEATVAAFVDGIFGERGLTRAKWVDTGAIERPHFEAILALLVQVGIVTGRKPGQAGRLTVDSAQAARAMLKLPPN